MSIINKKIDAVNVRVATTRALGELSQEPVLDAKLVFTCCKATASEQAEAAITGAFCKV